MSFTISPDVVTPEFLAEDLGPTILATASLMMIACTVFVGLRYWARYLTQTSFGAEDVMIPLAWIAEMGLCIVGIVMVKHTGAGRHTNVVLEEDPSTLERFLKGVAANELLHPAAVAFPKLCVVFLYLRVFTNKYERMAAWILIGVISATWFSYSMATLFQCMPIAFTWDKTIEGGKCFNFRAFATSSSVPNIVTDVAVIFLPIRTVVALKISIGRRAGLMLIFLMGSVGIIASIIRTAVFATTNPLFDPTFSATSLLNWTIIEPGLYLLAACALSFKPLFRMIARALHLNQLVSFTKSSFGKTTHADRKTNATGTPTIIRIETFQSGSSGGSGKLSEGKDSEADAYAKEVIVVGKDIEEGVWIRKAAELEEGFMKGISEGLINVRVNRPVPVESESRNDESNGDDLKLDTVDQEEGYMKGVSEGLIGARRTRTVQVKSEPQDEASDGDEMTFSLADQSFLLNMLEDFDKRDDA